MSSPLFQQELIEPAPARQVFVPAGYSSHWGVDPSTKRVAIAWVTPDGRRGVGMESFPALQSPQRLAAIHSTTRLLALSLEVDAPPGFIYVEQASGRNISVELQYAIGVTIAALAMVFGPRTVIETIPPASWKLRACGRGNIYKPKPSETHEYGVLTWAKENGYEGRSYDEADAYGIAEAARRTIRLDER